MANNGQTPKNSESISYISFQDLVKNPIELEWIIEGMISKGDSTLIHAPGGVGKSMFALYIALSLAALDTVDCRGQIPRKCRAILPFEVRGRAWQS